VLGVNRGKGIFPSCLLVTAFALSICVKCVAAEFLQKVAFLEQTRHAGKLVRRDVELCQDKLN